MDSDTFKEPCLSKLHRVMLGYASLSDATWQQLTKTCQPISLLKSEYFLRLGDVPDSIGFVCSGVLRAFTIDESGNEYNKIFFAENSFPASMVALLTEAPSLFALECLEDCQLLEIDYQAYRALLDECDDLMRFHIHYLEKNWIIDKEQRELSLVQADATARYLEFCRKYPDLEARIPQYHIASHLGITPTQLSRIRKNLAVTN